MLSFIYKWEKQLWCYFKMRSFRRESFLYKNSLWCWFTHFVRLFPAPPLSPSLLIGGFFYKLPYYLLIFLPPYQFIRCVSIHYFTGNCVSVVFMTQVVFIVLVADTTSVEFECWHEQLNFWRAFKSWNLYWSEMSPLLSQLWFCWNLSFLVCFTFFFL